MKKYNIDEKKKKEILYHAQICLHYNELLIEQSDGWLSIEEGNANMIKALLEKLKEETRIARSNRINRIRQLFRINKQIENK
jgi:predicted NAD/FAD-binding protein